jgi:hypothetical protein
MVGRLQWMVAGHCLQMGRSDQNTCIHSLDGIQTFNCTLPRGPAFPSPKSWLFLGGTNVYKASMQIIVILWVKSCKQDFVALPLYPREVSPKLVKLACDTLHRAFNFIRCPRQWQGAKSHINLHDSKQPFIFPVPDGIRCTGIRSNKILSDVWQL